GIRDFHVTGVQTCALPISSKSTFQELHFMIQQANGYPPDVPSSFYKSNDQWKKGQEIAFQPSDAKLARGVIEMKSAKLNQYINRSEERRVGKARGQEWTAQ